MSQLETNTTTIQSIMEKLEGKAAGGGSGGATVEMCTVTVNYVVSSSRIYYLDDNDGFKTVTISSNMLLPKNRMLICMNNLNDSPKTLNISNSTNTVLGTYANDTMNGIERTIFYLTADTATLYFSNS